MSKNNRVCFLCGQNYHYCPTCYPDTNKPSWYAMWCSEECKKLDNILAAHTMKHITTKEAKEKIEELKLKDIKFSDDNVKRHYNNIINYKEEIIVKQEENENLVNSQKENTKTNNKNRTKITYNNKVQNKNDK